MSACILAWCKECCVTDAAQIAKNISEQGFRSVEELARTALDETDLKELGFNMYQRETSNSQSMLRVDDG